MTTSIQEVQNRSDLKDWVLVPFQLYQDDPKYVPQIIREEMDFFSAGSNPCFSVADTKLLLIRQNNKTIGRVCGIIHRLEEEKLGYKRGRFGWFECIDDTQVAHAMLEHLENWFIGQGCKEITGPHGFSDLDPEGLLIEGFEALPTIAGSYNPPFYRRLLEDFGFQKEVDYLEHRVEFPKDSPLFKKMGRRVAAAESEGYKLVNFAKKKDTLKYSDQWWEVLEASFSQLFGVTPLSDDQKKYYTKKYFGFIEPDFLLMVVDENDIVQGLFLGLPSLSRAFQKAGGKLLPSGFLHILRSLKKYDTIDFYFAGVRPDANQRKIFPMLALAMLRTLDRHNVKYLETNRELETNTTITRIWLKYTIVNKRRSRVFKKTLSF